MSTEAHTHPVDTVEGDSHRLNGGDKPVEEPKPDRLSAVKARRKELAQKRSLVLIVPGYGSLVGVRYKALPRDELGTWITKLVEEDEPSLDDNIDLLIRCCKEVLVRQSKEDKWEPIDLDSAEPTTFSSGTLAGLLGEEAKTARDEVRVLFSPEGTQPMAPEQHSGTLIQWQQDADAHIDKALLGE